MTSADDICKKVYRRIKPQWWAAFWGCFIIGLLTYMYIMTNNFMTYDSTWNIYSDQDMITSGRQFLTYACGISSFYNLPWVNGVLAIFFLALTSVVVVEGFDIHSRIGAVLTGGLLVSFPAVASTFCYIFTIDGYMLAVLLSALAFLLADRKKWGFLGGIVLLGVSIGIYQAYLSFTIIMCVLRLLLDVIEKENVKEIWGKIWRYVVMGIGSYAFYVVTLKLMLKWKGMELSGYQGTDKVGSFSLSDLPAGLYSALKNFLRFIMPGNVIQSNNIMKIAFVVVFAIAIFFYFRLFIQKKRYKSVIRIVLTLALVASVPFGATIVNIISPDTFFHLLMRLPWVLLFIFVVVLAEKQLSGEKVMNQRVIKTLKATVAVGMVVFIWQFAILANIVAFNLNERYEKTYAICMRVADRLEQTPGYTTGTKVAILGGSFDHTYYIPSDMTRADLAGFFGADGSVYAAASNECAAVMKHYLNVTIVTVSHEEEVELALTEEFAQMPNFPAEGSIGFIGDVLVIKING